MSTQLYPSQLSKVLQFKSIIALLLISLLSLSANAQNGLRAEYYDGTNFDKLVAVRTEQMIDRSWNRIPPVEGINPHECSIRWTGKLRPGASGTYEFSARVDDGIRVWIDDQLIIDDWNLNDVGRFSGKVAMEANQEYDLKVEYFNALIEGEITLLWKIPTGKKRWYSRFFSKDYQVIASEFFFQPDPVASPRSEKVIAHVEEHSGLTEETSSPVTKRATPEPNKEVAVREKVVKSSVPLATTVEITETITPIITEATLEKYTPKNIEFERAKTTILEDSFKELNLFAGFMMEHPELTVKIEGHTDPVGNAEKNLELSTRRAYAVARYLVKKGVEAKRIEAEGFGGSQPLMIPEDGKYHPANRRVEFLISGLEENQAISQK